MKTLAVALLLTMVAAAPGTARADVAPLSVANGQVVAGKAPANLAGVSLFWSNTGWGGEKFYTRDVVRAMKKDWRASVIRIPVGVEQSGGYLDDPAGNLERVDTVIQAAIAQDLYVVVDWHSHEAEKHEAAAVEFFGRIAKKYGHHRHVVYEIYNEPLQVSWEAVIKPYAERVIAVIRAQDKDNLIVVGTPTWSQDVDVAARAPIAGRNIAYALHFYAGTHGAPLRDKAKVALDNKLPLFVTEWGSVNADGTGAVNREETAAWMQFLQDNRISHINWAINDKDESASAFLPGTMTLSPSGELARSIISAWPKKNVPAR